jgi:hypothetical protein
MRADSVVDSLPFQKLRGDVSQSKVRIYHLMKLLRMGAMGPLHTTIEFRAARWQDKEFDPSFAAAFFKLGHELRTPIYLDRPDHKGHPSLKGVQKTGCCGGSHPGMHLHYVPPTHDIPSRELLQHYSRKGSQVQGIYLHDVPWLLR